MSFKTPELVTGVSGKEEQPTNRGSLTLFDGRPFEMDDHVFDPVSLEDTMILGNLSPYAQYNKGRLERAITKYGAQRVQVGYDEEECVLASNKFIVMDSNVPGLSRLTNVTISIEFDSLKINLWATRFHYGLHDFLAFSEFTIGRQVGNATRTKDFIRLWFGEGSKEQLTVRYVTVERTPASRHMSEMLQNYALERKLTWEEGEQRHI